MFDKAARSRKAVSDMTDQEISAFVKTLKKLSTSKRFYRRYYSLGMIHHDNFHDVHTAGQFLAFVRMYNVGLRELTLSRQSQRRHSLLGRWLLVFQSVRGPTVA